MFYIIFVHVSEFQMYRHNWGFVIHVGYVNSPVRWHEKQISINWLLRYYCVLVCCNCVKFNNNKGDFVTEIENLNNSLIYLMKHYFALSKQTMCNQ